MISRPWSTLFLDAILGLVVLLFLLVNPIAKESTAKPRAEYTLIMQWDSTPHHLDMDLYVRLPNGAMVFFRNKDAGSVFIDRDHLGAVQNSSKSQQGPVRREDVQWVQPILPGSYLVSIHNYRGEAAGNVSLELMDKAGNRLWTAQVPVPGPQDETPMVELFFNERGELVSTEPSTTHLRGLRNAP